MRTRIKTTKKPKNTRRRKHNRATEIPDFPEFLKTLIGGMVKQSRLPEFRLYTFDQMLEMSAGFSEALMAVHSEEWNEFEKERHTLLAAEILDMCKSKYEIEPHGAGVLLFHVAMELLSQSRDHLKGGGGATV